MTHHLNTNKQFMIGNGILAFAVIFVVVFFIYMSMRLQNKNEGTPHFNQTYRISLNEGFVGDSISIFINDSLLFNQNIITEPVCFKIGRFAEHNVLLIVDNHTDRITAFNLNEQNNDYVFIKKGDEVILYP